MASGEPTRAPVTQTPSGSSGEAEPIPDPLHPTTHQPGGTFRVGDAEVTYLGVFATDGRLEVRLQVESGVLPSDASVGTPDGERLSLSDRDSIVRSEPFGDAAEPPASDATLTLAVGDLLVPLQVGKVR